jgi:hypothetical protein
MWASTTTAGMDLVSWTWPAYRLQYICRVAGGNEMTVSTEVEASWPENSFAR